MNLKKSSRANLENNRFTYFQIGLVFALSIALVAFEWKSTDSVIIDDGWGEPEDPIEEQTPIIVVEKHKPKTDSKPKPKSHTIQVATVVVAIDTANTPDDTLDLVFEPGNDSLFGNDNAGFDNDSIFVAVEEMPYACDCKKYRDSAERAICTDRERRKHLARTVKYPPIAKSEGIQGTVHVYYVVDDRGEVVDVKIAKGVNPYLDAEALKAVKSLPCHKPGKQRGRKVKVQFHAPIKFTLN
jgi:protein TonB